MDDLTIGQTINLGGAVTAFYDFTEITVSSPSAPNTTGPVTVDSVDGASDSGGMSSDSTR